MMSYHLTKATVFALMCFLAHFAEATRVSGWFQKRRLEARYRRNLCGTVPTNRSALSTENISSRRRLVHQQYKCSKCNTMFWRDSSDTPSCKNTNCKNAKVHVVLVKTPTHLHVPRRACAGSIQNDITKETTEEMTCHRGRRKAIDVNSKWGPNWREMALGELTNTCKLKPTCNVTKQNTQVPPPSPQKQANKRLKEHGQAQANKRKPRQVSRRQKKEPKFVTCQDCKGSGTIGDKEKDCMECLQYDSEKKKQCTNCSGKGRLVPKCKTCGGAGGEFVSAKEFMARMIKNVSGVQLKGPRKPKSKASAKQSLVKKSKSKKKRKTGSLKESHFNGKLAIHWENMTLIIPKELEKWVTKATRIRVKAPGQMESMLKFPMGGAPALAPRAAEIVTLAKAKQFLGEHREGLTFTQDTVTLPTGTFEELLKKAAQFWE